MRALRLTLPFLLVLGCPTEPDPEPMEPADPLTFAAEVSQSELEGTIEDLVAFGTRHTETDGDEAARDYLVDRLEAYGFAPELDPFSANGTPANNIIARVDGVEDPEVIYIFSAHYDSTSTDWQTDAPGADDNATGVAGVLEAARILQGERFAHSIWFVLTAAEEQGSLGSEHMAEWLDLEGYDVRGVIAPDMIGYWPLEDDDLMDILGDHDSEHLVEHMEGIADALGVANKTWVEHALCYGDDHTNFQEQGFPAISPMDCVEAHNFPASGEETPHYHRTSDTIDTLYMPFTTKVVGVIVASLADLAAPR